MIPKTSDKRIDEIKSLIPPAVIIEEIPSTPEIEKLVTDTRQSIHRILTQKDDRLLVVVGPCSVHDPESAREYADRLVKIREQYRDDLEIVMRVYFEKPRTTVGWKGLINDPDLDSSFKINKGLKLARELLIYVNSLGLPAGTEFLDIVTGQYYADIISWGAIGARTTESQIHRELASGLSCPVGFKNGTDGNIQIAIDAIRSANSSHIFLSPTQEGTTAIFHTTGNQDAHLILRGGKAPNYDAENIKAAAQLSEKSKVTNGLVVDFSHANSYKDFRKQADVCDSISKQIAEGDRRIAGVMLESFLVEGKQGIDSREKLEYGKSITDGCLGWDNTVELLAQLAQATQSRRNP